MKKVRTVYFAHSGCVKAEIEVIGSAQQIDNTGNQDHNRWQWRKKQPPKQTAWLETDTVDEPGTHRPHQ